MITSILLLATAALVNANPLPQDPRSRRTPSPAPQVERDDDSTANSFFSIGASCSQDTRNLQGTTFANRADFYKQAMRDAHIIADAATQWPQYGTDASDMYFGVHAEDPSSGFVNIITENFKAAREWGKPEWGWDKHIELTCDDPHNVCNNKIDDDPRPIACYVNNTADFWWTRSEINCCAPFFQTQTIEDAFNFNNGKAPADLHLANMRTSGSYLLHEMMHTLQITDKRPHIIDERFDPEFSTGKRIYGPKACRKAARVEPLSKTANNADSYAMFASAMYWKNRFGGYLPPPAAATDTSDDDDGPISDFAWNYPDQIPAPPLANDGSLTCAGSPTDKPSTTQSYAQSMINSYCDILESRGWVVNAGDGYYGPWGTAGGSSPPESDNVLWLSVAFNPSCSEGSRFKVNAADCKTYLSTALNGCNTDSIDRKWGGQVEASCAYWNMTTVFGQSETPPNGYSPSIGMP